VAQRDDDRPRTPERCRTKLNIHPRLQDRPIAAEHGKNVRDIDSILQPIQPIGTWEQIRAVRRYKHLNQAEEVLLDLLC
jgi:hypothetical protein